MTNPLLSPSTLPYGLPPFADIEVRHYSEAVEAGLARLPLPDAGVLLSRLAHAAGQGGASYLEARARELSGELQLPTPDALPTVRLRPVEDPAEEPTVLFERVELE